MRMNFFSYFSQESCQKNVPGTSSKYYILLTINRKICQAFQKRFNATREVPSNEKVKEGNTPPHTTHTLTPATQHQQKQQTTQLQRQLLRRKQQHALHDANLPLQQSRNGCWQASNDATADFKERRPGWFEAWSWI